MIVDGVDAFVLYDFVTDTDVGAMLCGEYVNTDYGLIRSSTLIFDWRRWPEVSKRSWRGHRPAQVRKTWMRPGSRAGQWPRAVVVVVAGAATTRSTACALVTWSPLAMTKYSPGVSAAPS